MARAGVALDLLAIVLIVIVIVLVYPLVFA
jgi:hypothetical protein